MKTRDLLKDESCAMRSGPISSHVPAPDLATSAGKLRPSDLDRTAQTSISSLSARSVALLAGLRHPPDPRSRLSLPVAPPGDAAPRSPWEGTRRGCRAQAPRLHPRSRWGRCAGSQGPSLSDACIPTRAFLTTAAPLSNSSRASATSSSRAPAMS